MKKILIAEDIVLTANVFDVGCQHSEEAGWDGFVASRPIGKNA